MVVLQEYWPFFKLFGTIGCPVIFIAAFATRLWVRVDNREYGLWSWCFTNFTDEDASKGGRLENVTRCFDIQPGDGGAYFEATRVMACFALFCYLTFFMTFNPQQGLGKGKHPLAVAVSSAVMCAITLVAMGSGYRDDARWRGHTPKLGLSIWLAVGSGCVCLFMCLVHFMVERINNPPAARNASSQPTPASGNPPPYNTATRSTMTAPTSRSTRTTTTTTTTASNSNNARDRAAGSSPTTSTTTNTTTPSIQASRGSGARSASVAAATATATATARQTKTEMEPQRPTPPPAAAGESSNSSSSSPRQPLFVIPASPPPAYNGIDNYGYQPPPAYTP